MQILYQERYRDFTVKHFHEQLQKRHDYKLGYTVTRLALQASGLAAKTQRRGNDRKKRERRPLPGMLLFQDGSTHRWIAGLDHDLDLVVTLDDATGAIYSAILVAQEGTMSSFLGLSQTIAEKGLFRAFYTDRGSHYFFTPRAGGKSLPLRRRGSTNRSSPRSAGPSGSSASPTSRPIRPRRAVAWSGCSAPYRAGCRPSCGWPRSPPSRPPTATSKRTSCPTTTPASPCRPPRRARPSSPMPAGRSRTSCASRKAARSAATIASIGTASPCRSRRSAIATTTSRRPCACTDIPTAGSPSSTGRAASPASTLPHSRSMPRGPLNSARPARPDGFVDNAARCPQPHRPINHSSGHLTCYERRTSSRATDIACPATNSHYHRIDAVNSGDKNAFRSGADPDDGRLQASRQHGGAAADRIGDDGRQRRPGQCRALQLFQRGQLGAAGRAARDQPGRGERRRLQGHRAQHPRQRRVRRQPGRRGF